MADLSKRDADGFPPRSVRTFRSSSFSVKNIIDCRRKKRLYLRCFPLLVMLWLAAFGYIGNKVEKQEAMRRQIDVNKLIMDKGGIQINVDGDVYLCDIAMYKAFNDQAWDSRDLINATLLASAKYSQNPPELKSLMVNNAFVKSQMQIIIAIIFVFVGLLISLPYLLWQDPLRILLLRPFDQRNVTRSLKKFICRNLSGWGHVLTLTDRHINESYFKNSTRFFSPRRLIYEVLIFFYFHWFVYPAYSL